jgi:hypothetical protein
MEDPDPSSGPPEFDAVFEDGDVERRIYGTVLGLREPTSASAVADTVDCDPKTARKYLSFDTGDGTTVTFTVPDARRDA